MVHASNIEESNDRCKVSWAIQEKYLFNSDCLLFGKGILASFKYDQLVHI